MAVATTAGEAQARHDQGWHSPRFMLGGDFKVADPVGDFDRFVDGRATIDVHELLPDSDYYLAAFLVGAYQEALGDLHNLFGDTHVVHVRLHEEGGWWIDETVEGDTAREVLGYMQYDAARLQPLLARDCEIAVREGRMTVAETRMLLRFYQAELGGYTYLEADT